MSCSTALHPLSFNQPEVAGRRLVWQEHHLPRADNGEAGVARALSDLGLPAIYEPWQYDLGMNDHGERFGFRPDFWLPATTQRPQLHVEVTWLDWVATCPWRTSRSTQVRFAKKLLKIDRTRQLYGIETVLVTHAKCRQILRDAVLLQDLIDRVARRAA